MAAYHQMGNDSWNLVTDDNVGSFGGLILSPVNDKPGEAQERLYGLGLHRGLMDVILDPQLYKPQSVRGCLTFWSYFPKDIDTADTRNDAWWDAISDRLIQSAGQLGCNAVCSPAMLPKRYDDDYYTYLVARADATKRAAGALPVLMTCIVSPAELIKDGCAEHVATILSRSRCERAYLILDDGSKPKSQMRDHEAVLGVMQLIRLLERADIQVLVSSTGFDMAVWKHAGASHVATGKFFNLRRFTPGRWDEEAGGGPAVPYWTEFGMFTWLRDFDMRLLKSENLLDRVAAQRNPYSRQILQLVESTADDEKWLGLSWRQWLHEFALKEAAYSTAPGAVEEELVAADLRWKRLDELELLIGERGNDGTWVRSWLNAIRLWRGKA